MNNETAITLIRALLDDNDSDSGGGGGGGRNPAHHLIGQRVIIRTRISGVSFGTLETYDAASRTATLVNAHRIWNWQGAFTCSELAISGAVCRTDVHPDRLLISDEGLEILPLTAAADTRILAEMTIGSK